MKKILTSVLFLCLLSGLVFAGGEQEKGAADENVTVKFATWGVVESPLRPYFDYVKENFEKENPGITVEWVGFPYDAIKQQTLIMAAAGDMPDGIQSARPWYNAYAPTGYFANMGEVMGDEYMNDLLPDLKNELKYEDGNFYAIPWKVCSFTLAWNKELFKQAGLDPEKPPKTYEEVLAYSEKLSKLKDADGNQVYGFSFPGTSNTASGDYLLSLIWSFGGDPWAAGDKGTERAFEFLQTMYEKGYSPGVQDFKDNRNMFALGRLGMYYDHVWGVGNAWKLNEKAKGFTGIQGPLGTQYGDAASTMEGHLILVNQDSEHKAEIAKLIKFMTNPQSMKVYRELQPFYLVSKTQEEELSEYIDDPMMKHVSNWSETIKPLPIREEMEEICLDLTAQFQGVVSGKFTPAEAAANVKQKVKEIW